MVFVNSMSDMFGDFVPDEYLDRVFEVMRSTPQHTYQVLTKRADRLEKWTSGGKWLASAKHIWLGVSGEDKKYGVPRIEHLRRGVAGIRSLSTSRYCPTSASST
jgi:protein gp37